MSKKDTIKIELNTKTAIEVLLVLETATNGYSKEFPPERIVRLRELMSDIDSKLEKTLLTE